MMTQTNGTAEKELSELERILPHPLRVSSFEFAFSDPDQDTSQFEMNPQLDVQEVKKSDLHCLDDGDGASIGGDAEEHDATKHHFFPQTKVDNPTPHKAHTHTNKP